MVHTCHKVVAKHTCSNAETEKLRSERLVFRPDQLNALDIRQEDNRGLFYVYRNRYAICHQEPNWFYRPPSADVHPI